jgi:hypothetical protein
MAAFCSSTATAVHGTLSGAEERQMRTQPLRQIERRDPRGDTLVRVSDKWMAHRASGPA